MAPIERDSEDVSHADWARRNHTASAIGDVGRVGRDTHLRELAGVSRLEDEADLSLDLTIKTAGDPIRHTALIPAGKKKVRFNVRSSLFST